MVRRKALVVDPGTTWEHEAGRLSALSNWEFCRVADIKAAQVALADRSIAVGLIIFDRPDALSAAEVETMVAAHDVEWIAIVGPAVVDGTAIGNLIASCFLDFHRLPLDEARLLTILGHAYGKAMLREHAGQPPCIDSRYGMTGRSQPMIDVFRQIDKIVKVDAPVLISGESGTGKELVARAIHRLSSRAQGPFIAMNCAAIPANLIQSELFGHEKGAFTGAHRRHVGSVEAADQGVLFLDEIGDLPLELQANLLRFLQEGSIIRLGATEHLKVNVRVIAASHVNLQQAMAEHRFREDLYYRLKVLDLRLPALRERRDDIPLLAETVFRDFSAHKTPQLRGFSSEALRAMCEYDWPGNVRELINRVHSAMIMSENRLISASDLGLTDDKAASALRTLGEARALMEKEFLEKTLRENHNNLTQSARQLGVSRVTIYRMIERFGIML